MSTDKDSADCPDLAALLKEVGARDEPPAELVHEVHAAVHAEWQALVSARRRQARVRWAVAATVLVAATLGVIGWQASINQAPIVLAAVTRVDGTVASTRATTLQVGTPLTVGETLHTGKGARVALALRSGLSLRLDDDTTVMLAAADRVQLIAGALYLDSPPSTRGVALEVEALGTSIRHIGTQYQVRILAPSVQIGVREGRVAVTNAAGSSTGQAGESIEIAADGTVSRKVLPPWDTEWQWVSDAAPPFAIAGQPLSRFLDWVARETGRQLIYTSPAAEQVAARVRMQGTIAGLDIATALNAVLATTQLQAQSKAQVLEITLKE